MKKNILKNKKIVILVISDFFHDARVLKEAKSAQKAGMKVTIITKKTNGTKSRELMNGIRIIRVETFIDKYILPIYIKLTKRTSATILSNKISDKKMSLFESLGIVLSVWFTNRAFVNASIKIKPDIIHANDPVTLPAATQIKQLTNTKIIYDSHELYLKLLKYPHFIWLRYFSDAEYKIKNVDGIISVNPYIINKLISQYNISNMPYDVVLNSPIYQKISMKKPCKSIKILYIGKTDAQRGVLQFAKQIKNIKNLEFTVLGDDLSKFGINSIPIVKPDEVVGVASNYDIGIIPFVDCSQSVYNSLPNKLFEYMTAGLMIISSDLPEISKIINVANNGIIYNPKNKNDIISKIKYLINNPDKLVQYKINSLKYAKEYSWEKQEKKLLKMYKKVLQKND